MSSLSVTGTSPGSSDAGGARLDGRQDAVNTGRSGVKRALFRKPFGLPTMQTSVARDTIRGVRDCRGEGARMADLAYAVLIIVIFAVLALTLRGLERL